MNKEITTYLDKLFPNPVCELNYKKDYELLIAIVLSAQTTDKRVNKGDEKGYFKFGGSTTILFFEKNKIKIDSDILEQSEMGFECKVNCGERIGLKLK